MKIAIKGWMRFGSCVAAGMLALGAAHAETGITIIVNGVTNNAAGDYYVGNTGPLNWLVVTNAGVLNVASNGFVGFSTGASNNTAVVTGTGSVWTNGGALTVGYATNANNNQLTISNGAQVNNGKGDIGYDGANNSVLVTGSNSLWNSSDMVVVGDHTSGNSLTVSNGAKVQSKSGYIGYAAGASSNTVRVTGPNSTWKNYGVELPLYLGYGINANNNQLIVSDGGQVKSGGLGYLGYLGDGNSILVTGTNSLWRNASIGVYLGYQSAGNSVTVSNGGRVEVPGFYSGFDASSSNNAIVVTGPGTILDASQLILGWHGASRNSLTVSAGARIINGYNWSAIGDTYATPTPSFGNTALITGSGSQWNTSSDIYVGRDGYDNSITVADGAQISSSYVIVGPNSGASNNSALVTGPGSLWNASDVFTVGGGGDNNRLTVTNGGQVIAAGGSVGDYAGSDNNTALVSGSGSAWSNTAALYIGDGGANNQLTVTNGAQVFATAATVGNNGNGNSALVSGSGSVWSNTAAFYVGNGGVNNQLTVNDGGQVFATEAAVGNNGNSNTVLLSGAGSAWVNTGALNLGSGGVNNQLTITNGGQVFAAGGTVGSGAGASNNSVVVTGSGSLWNNTGGLTVGNSNANNRLTIANGAQVSSATANAYVGNNGNNNSVLVAGPGSVWTNSAPIYVGLQGDNNQLAITNAAKVINNNLAAVGWRSKDNTVLVSGADSAWLISSMLTVGNASTNNQLTIANGAQVSATRVYVGRSGYSDNNSALVTGPGSVLTNSGALYLANDGSSVSNQLTIANGGTVYSASFLEGAHFSSNSTVLVSGSGSVWKHSGNFTIGGDSVGAQLTITNGAQVFAANVTVGVGDYAQNASALVTGPGSVWSNTGTFYLGDGNVSNHQLTIANGGAVYNTTGTIGRRNATDNSVLVTGTGSLWNNSGDLNVGGYSSSNNHLTITNSGAVLVGGNATINSPNGGITVSGGSLIATNAAAGVLNLNSGSLKLNGGTVTVNQFIATNAASALAVEFGGSGPDSVLTISDTAQVGGTLSVTNPPGFTPALSNAYTILKAGSITGQFAATNLTSLGGGMRWSVLTSSTSVVAQAISDTATPTVTTDPVSNVTHSAAQSGGTVTTVEGGSPVTARGVCWNLGGTPTVADSHTTDGSGTGSFTSQLTGLAPSQTYHVRAYATSAAGTGYGADRTCTTLVAPPGNTLSFNGSNQYVNIPDANSLDMTNNYTLECWLKADSFGSGGGALNLRGLIGKYQSIGSLGYFLRMNLNELDFDQMVTSGLNLQSNRWYHVAAVNSNGTRRLYVNGVEKALTGSAITVVANTDELRLGSDYRGRYFAGQMDEVRIWNAARAQTDVQDAMHKPLAGSESGLVAYYQFNANSGTALADLTANANTGSLSNSPAWAASTFPSASLITDRTNLRGAWLAQTNSLASSRLTVTNAVASGTDFAVFGHDNTSDAWQTADVPAGVNSRLTRVWRAEVSGSASGDIKIDTTGLSSIGDGSTLRLLIDADGTFANSTVVTGTYSAPYFTVAGQTITSGNYYTLGNNIPQFTNSGVTIPAATSAWHGAAWGDYDNDGDLDFVLNGKLYRNNGNGTFTDMSASAGLTAVASGLGGAAWGDFDGDGWLDLALSGDSGSSVYITRIYRNNGNGTFTDINAGLPGLYYARVAWGDYDNDGRPDLLVAGNVTSGTITRIYRNNGDGTFTDSGISFPGVGQGDVAWGDYNNDGKLDVVVHGANASGKITQIYGNNGDGTFTDISAGLTGDSWGSVAWMDYNNNGKLDLLISGTSGSGYNLLYRNNGDGSFTNIAGTSLWMSQRSGVAWGDYNNDGNPDILISGSSKSALYRNNGDDTFTDIAAGLPTASWGGVALGDYDNDGRLDFLFSGSTATLYHNTSSATSNSAPTAPVGLSATRTNTTATFTWDAATDTETPAAGLSYNLRVGTASGLNDVMPSESDSSGFRRVPVLGNVQMNRSWTLTLAPGTTYHWSVQAIDGAFAGSVWATEGTITIPNLPVVTTAVITGMTTTTATSGGNITAAGDSPVTARGVCYNTTGTPTLSDTCTTNGSGTGIYTSSLTGLTMGQTYYVRAYATSASGTSYGSQRAFVLHDSSTALTPPGNALLFNGASTQYVQVAHTVELGFTANYALELWLKADTVSGVQALVSKNQSGRGWSLGLNNSDVVFDGLTTSGLGLTAGTWYHVAAVNSNGTRYLYVNGVATTLTGTATTVQYSIDAVTIGSGSGFFSGRMDELRIWNRSLTQQEVRETMHLVGGGASGLIAYYDFDATSGTTLTDSAQAAAVHTGTLTNMAGTEWTRSTIPAGNGSVNTQTEATGTVAFSGTSLSADFTTAGAASLTTTRITADMPRGTWPANLAVFSPWFVVDRFGSGSFSANLTITVGQGMDATDQANPSGVGLYRRDATSEGAWTLVTTASSVDVATQTALFPNVTNFGQLAVGHTVMRKLATTLPGTGEGEHMALAWGDFNNDGKLDLAFFTAGSSDIYRNNGDGTFSGIAAGLPLAPGTLGSTVAWADYNGDGHLDLALGNISGTYIYRNNGNNTFTKVATLSPGTLDRSQTLIWGDYNNDGRPDLLVIGGTSGSVEGITRLYRNDGNDTFTDSGVSFPNNQYAAAAWGDYDNDGYLDLVITGMAGAHIYHNNGNGTFTDIGANGLVVGRESHVAWGDYDNDGWLDLALGNGSRLSVYHNNHNGTFTDIGLTAQVFGKQANVAWGDYDNDGRLDLLTCADINGGMGGEVSTLFHNNGQGSFTDLGINFFSGGNSLVRAAFGDYDNDGRLDVAVLGYNSTDLWRNYSVAVNTPPTAPTGLAAGVAGGVATLSWNAASDNETPASGLTYNLRVGTAPGKDDVMSAMADTTSGLRKVPALGNVQMNRSWNLTLPASGTYYWSVQAVDTGLEGGAFGTESSFSVTLDTDGDTLPNEWEATYYGGSTNANPDALAANGVNTVREAYIADLNPTNPASFFRITAISNQSPWTVYFEASADRAYTLLGVSNLVSGVWTNVPGAGPRPGTGGADTLSDTNVPPKGPFYRLKVELP